MEPVQREKIVQVKYWDCGDPKCTHLFQQSAIDCIAKRNAPPPPTLGPAAVDQLLSIKIYKEVLNRATYKRAAEIHNVTEGQAYARFNKIHQKMIEHFQRENPFERVTLYGGTSLPYVRKHAKFWLERIPRVFGTVDADQVYRK